MKTVNVGFLGCGNIGCGVYRLLQECGGTMMETEGVRFAVRKILVRDPSKPRAGVDTSLLTSDPAQVLDDAQIDIVMEFMGGEQPAADYLVRALEHGKSVVTANKKLLAEYGKEIFDTARANDVDIYFGASVGGGIPIIRVLREGLAGNDIESIHGILNGTCNYILTRMENEGLPFDEVLKDAQKLGYAEANPSLDIDGFDTAHKACILSALAYGFQPTLEQVQVEGIRNLSAIDVKYAADFGYRIKLLACVAKDGDEVEVGVHPTLIPFSHMLANVNDAFNAAMVKGDMSDYTMYYGRGAGRQPTASTVVGDIGDIARNLAHGETRYERGAPNYAEGAIKLRAAGDIASKFYLRFMLADKPGATGIVATALGKHGVSISAISQKSTSGGNQPVPVVVLTHKAKASELDAALEEIKASGIVGEAPVKLRML